MIGWVGWQNKSCPWKTGSRKGGGQSDPRGETMPQWRDRDIQRDLKKDAGLKGKPQCLCSLTFSWPSEDNLGMDWPVLQESLPSLDIFLPVLHPSPSGLLRQLLDYRLLSRGHPMDICLLLWDLDTASWNIFKGFLLIPPFSVSLGSFFCVIYKHVYLHCR